MLPHVTQSKDARSQNFTYIYIYIYIIKIAQDELFTISQA